MKKGIIVFRPWNMLGVLAFFAIIAGIIKFNVSMPVMDPRYFIIGGIFAALGGMGYFMKNLIHFMNTFSWNRATAVITASRIEKIDDSDGIQYSPVIYYTYSVGTAEYSSSRIYPTGSWSSSFPSIALKPVSRYPVGKSVQVYYNPSRPEESFLERKGLVFNIVGMLSFAIMLAAFSLVLSGVVEI